MADTNDIPHDLSFGYSLKALFEEVLGSGSFLELKECHDLRVWKKQSLRLLEASKLSFKANLKIADKSFLTEVDNQLRHGVELVKSSKNINQLFSTLAAVYARLSFFQLGSRLQRRKPVPLKIQYWALDTYRSVQYVQSFQQQARLAGALEGGQTSSEKAISSKFD